MFDFSRNIVAIIVKRGLKLYNFTMLAAGVETDKFVICSCACLIELKTEQI